MSGNGVKSGTKRIAEERARQLRGEGWSAKHDDAHRRCELVMAAVCYAAKAAEQNVYIQKRTSKGHLFMDPWPSSWDSRWDKRHSHRGVATKVRMLEKAGALIAAEIDRLQRHARNK